MTSASTDTTEKSKNWTSFPKSVSANIRTLRCGANRQWKVRCKDLNFLFREELTAVTGKMEGLRDAGGGIMKEIFTKGRGVTADSLDV